VGKGKNSICFIAWSKWEESRNEVSIGNGGVSEGAEVAIDNLVADLLVEAVELGRRGKQ
jgi:hypothetical protein